MKVKDVGEAGLIRLIEQTFPTDGLHIVQGIGDDCAVQNASSTLLQLATMDTLVEGTHFDGAWTSPYHLGYKAMVVNVSDIAAMGGYPQSALLSLALPPELPLAFAKELLRGLRAACVDYEILLVGGDCVRSKEAAVVTLSLQGVVEPEALCLRSGAQPGDILLVTGSLGEARAGFLQAERGICQGALYEALLCPRAHLGEGRFLAKLAGVHALQDLSDGLFCDVQRLCAASGCGAQIDLESLPCSAAMTAFAAEQGCPAWELAVCGGEDYCLLCSLSPAAFQRIQDTLPSSWHCIGYITAEDAVHYTLGGTRVDVKPACFQHFAKEGEP